MHDDARLLHCGSHIIAVPIDMLSGYSEFDIELDMPGINGSSPSIWL